MRETQETSVAKGKKNRAIGATFEKRVRADLESKGWIVDRFTNNVEKVCYPNNDGEMEVTENCSFSDALKSDGKFPIMKLIPAKVTWRRTPHGMFPMGLNSGFPDFVMFRKNYTPNKNQEGLYVWLYEVIGVECKSNGILTKIEKQKCQWYLDNNIFSRIDIAEKTKIKNRVVIVYHNFVERYGK